MPTKREAGAGGAGLVVGALAAYLLFGRKSEAAVPGPPPVIPGPPPAPPPAGVGGYTWPNGFDRVAAFRAAAAANGLPAYLVWATAIAESGSAWPPLSPNECATVRNAQDCTFYPMGIRSATIATAMGQGGDWNASTKAYYDSLAYNVATQIELAGRLLGQYWRNANLLSRSVEQQLHLVRAMWQYGPNRNDIQGGRLPPDYKGAWGNHWAQAVRLAGGPDISNMAALAGVDGYGALSGAALGWRGTRRGGTYSEDLKIDPCHGYTLEQTYNGLLGAVLSGVEFVTRECRSADIAAQLHSIEAEARRAPVHPPKTMLVRHARALLGLLVKLMEVARQCGSPSLDSIQHNVEYLRICLDKNIRENAVRGERGIVLPSGHDNKLPTTTATITAPSRLRQQQRHNVYTSPVASQAQAAASAGQNAAMGDGMAASARVVEEFMVASRRLYAAVERCKRRGLIGQEFYTRQADSWAQQAPQASTAAVREWIDKINQAVSELEILCSPGGGSRTARHQRPARRLRGHSMGNQVVCGLGQNCWQ